MSGHAEGGPMIGTMIRSSLRNNRLVSGFLAGFLLLSTALLSGALILAMGVLGTVDGYMETARTPHFMQMHQGTLDIERMQRFVDGRDDVVAWEPIEYLNVDNSQLTFDGQSLDAEIQQNGFVRAPERMDLLLSVDGEVLDPGEGDVYVPGFYADKYDLAAGDEVTMRTPGGSMALTVRGEFRDSQMNSALASSKRLLISDADYAELRRRTGTDPEYLISFRLDSPSDVSGFEAAYAGAGLEAEGPSITWTFFRIVNSINDLVTVLLFMVMSGIILLIGFLCIRYTLLTTLEEDMREIGTMRSLGVRADQVRAIYVGKFRILLGGGALVGLALALALRGQVLAGVREQMGQVNNPVLGLLAAVLGAVLLYALSMLYTRRVMRRLRRVTPLDAMQGRAALSRRRRPLPVVGSTAGGWVNAKLAWASIRRTRSQHLTVLAVASLITLALLLPFRFSATMGAPDFVTYMGMGQYDVRVDLLNRDDALEQADRIAVALDGDSRVEAMATYRLEVESTRMPNGETASLRVDYGDPEAFPLRYADGRAPRQVTEIGLSEVNAERFAADVGDTIPIEHDGSPVEFTVSGIYQDVTNGGKTAKALPGATADQANPGVMIALAVSSDSSPQAVVEAVSEAAPEAQVIATADYVQQMMGGLLGTMNTIAWVFSVVALTISALMAGLSIRLMQVTEDKENAVMGALAFTSAHLRGQYLARILSMTGIGVLLGIVLATPLGVIMGNAVFASVGVGGLSLKFHWPATVLGGALVVMSAWAITMLNTRPTFNRSLAERLRG